MLLGHTFMLIFSRYAFARDRVSFLTRTHGFCTFFAFAISLRSSLHSRFIGAYHPSSIDTVATPYLHTVNHAFTQPFVAYS
ncbi:hypothetical protein EV361DRAFT_909860 [Lentinula raphanica]|nr:hypothetical protein EV361DRAFT_909860 [Lentinula raphanica]